MHRYYCKRQQCNCRKVLKCNWEHETIVLLNPASASYPSDDNISALL